MSCQKIALVDIGEKFILKDKGIDNTTGYNSVGELISTILPNIYVVASVILFILILAGGFAVISSAGNPEKKAKGSKAITGAVIGYLLIFISFWIIRLIEFLTGVPIFSPGF